ncbi:MAG: DNA-formamidopyrimidine glycosylase family protein [candidate division WOR-3 bacterium]|jgi:formamidopyrimidine-DNA glycosylase
MFELPEYVTIARQMNETLRGKVIERGVLGNSPHKFVWYNRKHKDFEKLTRSKKIGEARAKGRWLFVDLKPGYVLLFGECGGKILYHESEASVPKKYHLYLAFNDGSSLTATTQMWGAYELHVKGEERNRKYVKGMKTTPIEGKFTLAYFNALINGLIEKKSVKGLLTQDQLIPGLGNAIAQDIMFKAGLHPRHPVESLTTVEKRRLYRAIKSTVSEVIGKSGRYDEYDLFGEPGRYVRLMDKNAVGKPCPKCGTRIEKMQYLGGACYFCLQCQK